MDQKLNLKKFKKMRTASSISKIKVKLTYPPPISEYTPSKIKRHINEILSSISTYNKYSKSTTNKLITRQCVKNAKENLILSLREDLEYHKKIKEQNLIYEQYAKDISDYYKQNLDEICKYKDDLREDLFEFVTVIEGYEDDIKQCNIDRETMIRTNNDIIRYKEEEKEKMNQRISVLDSDLNQQKMKLDEVNGIYNSYRSQNDNYISNLNKSELDYMKQYEFLEAKFKILETQYNFYFDKEIKRRKFELDLKNNNIGRDETENANLELQDKIVKNVYLKEIANDIKKLMNEIEIANQKYMEEQKMIKFLGKNFYNKVKQRREQKGLELTKESINKDKRNNSKNNIFIKTERAMNKSQSKPKVIKRKFRINAFIKTYNSKNINNKNKKNEMTTHYTTTNNIKTNENYIKDTCFSSYQNTKNKAILTTNEG